VSVLRPETLAILKTARDHRGFFPNAVAAEQFEMAHTRGPFKVLPTVLGTFVVYDGRAPMNKGVVETCPNIREAHAALERHAAGEGPSRPQAAQRTEAA